MFSKYDKIDTLGDTKILFLGFDTRKEKHDIYDATWTNYYIILICWRHVKYKLNKLLNYEQIIFLKTKIPHANFEKN